MRNFSQTYGIRSLSSNTMCFVAVRAEGKEIPPELKAAPPVVGGQRRRKPHYGRHREPQSDAQQNSLLAKEPLTGTAPVRSIALGTGSVEEKQVDPLALLHPERLLSSINEIVNLLGEVPFALRHLHGCAISALREGLTLSDVLLFDRPDPLSPYILADGCGPLFDSVRGRVGLVSPENRDVFGISLSRREDVLIENGRESKIAQYIPLWMRLNAPVGSLILLPVHDGEAVSGLVCGSRAAGPPLRLSSQVLQTLRALRIHLATARRLASNMAALSRPSLVLR